MAFIIENNLKTNKIPRVNVLGVGISAVNMDMTINEILRWRNQNSHEYICVTGVHGVMESNRNESIKDIHNRAGLATPDGMPLVWLGRINGFSNINRVYGPDLLVNICGHTYFKGCSHFFYGSTNATLEQLSRNLESKFPGINIVGLYAPPFRQLTPEEDKLIINRINQVNPDFLWVGLSTPKQEIWMAEHIDKIPKPIMVGVGAAFDFHAGVKKQAPSWMQSAGLEWLFRLISEPKRLGRRYLVNNPTFIALAFIQLLGLKKYSL